MSRLLRIALTWCLALALPVQGYAASTMLGCGLAPNTAAPAAAAAAHVHADGAAAHHHDVTAAQAGSHAALDHDAATDVDAATTSCSVCAACCVTAAIASAMPVFDVAPLPVAFAVTAIERYHGVTTAGLERPPRTVLA